MARCEDVRRALGENGLLLLQDKTLPSVVGILTGESLAGSWWSHPRAHAIFACLETLADDSDILATRLVARKVTFVHRRLWPALIAVAIAREPWQTTGLSAAARRLLAGVDRDGEQQAHGPAVRELEKRLLVRTREVHTESGAHAMRVESWESLKVKKLPDVDAAKRELEEVAQNLGAGPAALPWRQRRKRVRS